MKDYRWNLKMFYRSSTDPKIESDMLEIEGLFDGFAKKYDTAEKEYLKNEDTLLKVLTDAEKLMAFASPKPLLYFYSLKDIDSTNTEASAKFSLYLDRMVKCDNKVTFFAISLGNISKEYQAKFLKSEKLKHFRVFLERAFMDAKHSLSVEQEKIMNLKVLPAHEMWVMGNEKILNGKSVSWKGKKLPISSASQLLPELSSAKDRKKLWSNITDVLESIASISEIELNAIITNKKIDDELRGYEKPYDNTVRKYRNDPKVVEQLTKTVSANFAISHKFYKLKAKLLKLNTLRHSDRAAKLGTIKTKFPFDYAVATLKSVFGNLNPFYSGVIDKFVKNGQIDVFPRVGKLGGAYCNHSFDSPTLLLLNYTDDLYSFTTMAHEFGHAFHSELSRERGPIYSSYSTALAETASTLFEAIALESVFEKLSDKEKIIVLHDKISDGIATVFCQVAGFNNENALHDAIRTKGYISKEEIADLYVKNMSEYLGPLFRLERKDGYMFVRWSHIRMFFYVYTYAFGMLVSKALLRRYRADKAFWTSIEKFLKAGGKDSPENILREIGIDVSKPDFWQEGLREIERDIDLLEKLTDKK